MGTCCELTPGGPSTPSNVYPVPDGDTGTNMALTLEFVVVGARSGSGGPRGPRGVPGPDFARGRRSRAPPACRWRRCARPSPTGRSWGPGGTPGVILSQLLRVFTVRLRRRARGTSTGSKWRGGSAAGAMQSTRARPGGAATGRRDDPHRGRGRGGGGRAPGPRSARASWAVGRWASRASPPRRWRALPSRLPVLAQAGVVDAGGRGYLLLLDSML